MFVAVKVIITKTLEIKAINLATLLFLKTKPYKSIQIPFTSIAKSKLYKMSLTISILLVFSTFSMFD
jgi:hypothetical protein